MTMSNFSTVLVANRGEIAVRVITTLRRLGIRSVAVFSDADVNAPHVRLADSALRLGPAPATESYLNIERVVDAAISSGSDAIHPGYGFLSENVAFARACADAGVVFIGPPVGALEAMGDKIRAKATAIEAGVPVVPGRHDPDMDDTTIIEAARDMGFPVLLKPSAGGGGKGMRIVTAADDLPAAIASARREARGSFGDDTLLIERFVTQPRHIEVQVFGDTHGQVIHLGERECSLQRRHQKVIEEAPSPLLDTDTRERLCASAVRLAQAVGYVGAGTVEYVVPAQQPEDFAFLEMNTRLQVEHPVTEMITGVDLVEWQIRIAEGQPIPLRQDEVAVCGHAVEARVYAEDPMRGFIPTGGEVLEYRPPAQSRVDSGIEAGSVIGSDYDPMLAKVISHAGGRQEAIDRLLESLAHTVLLGFGTNIDYLRFLLSAPQVQAGDLDTGLIDRLGLPEEGDVPLHALVAMVAGRDEVRTEGGFDRTDGWRIGGQAALRLDVNPGDRRIEFFPPERLVIDDVEHRVSLHRTGHGHHTGQAWEISVDGAVEVLHIADEGDHRWVHGPRSGTHRLQISTPLQRRIRTTGSGPLTGRWSARSPMPGTVVALEVTPGTSVMEGDPVVIVEAMKMEHTLRAPAAGVVAAVRTNVGAQVRLDEELVDIDLSGEDS
jgi:acetyl-CoA/propionyl-CoA carboxylase biotin carboxyl carrier protein